MTHNTEYITRNPLDVMYIVSGLKLNCPEYQFIKKHKAGITIVTEGSMSPDKYVNYALTFTDSKIELMYQLAFDRLPFKISKQRYVEISEQIINCRSHSKRADST